MLMEDFVTCFLTGSNAKRITLWAGDVIYVGSNTVGCVVLLLFFKGDVHLLIRTVKLSLKKKAKPNNLGNNVK